MSGNSGVTNPTMDRIAMHQVLDTAELLEMILLQLDSKTLLACHRVSKAFQEAMKTSPALLRHLFINPRATDNAADEPSSSPLVDDIVLNKEIVLCSRGCCSFRIMYAPLPPRSGRDNEYMVTFDQGYCGERTRSIESWQGMLLEQPPRGVRINQLCRLCGRSYPGSLTAGARLRDLDRELFEGHDCRYRRVYKREEDVEPQKQTEPPDVQGT